MKLPKVQSWTKSYCQAGTSRNCCFW